MQLCSLLSFSAQDNLTTHPFFSSHSMKPVLLSTWCFTQNQWNLVDGRQNVTRPYAMSTEPATTSAKTRCKKVSAIVFYVESFFYFNQDKCFIILDFCVKNKKMVSAMFIFSNLMLMCNTTNSYTLLHHREMGSLLSPVSPIPNRLGLKLRGVSLTSSVQGWNWEGCHFWVSGLGAI